MTETKPNQKEIAHIVLLRRLKYLLVHNPNVIAETLSASFNLDGSPTGLGLTAPDFPQFSFKQLHSEAFNVPRILVSERLIKVDEKSGGYTITQKGLTVMMRAKQAASGGGVN